MPLMLALAVVAFLAVNLAAGLALGSARLDLTSGRLYTLSPVTRGIIRDMHEPVRLRFYASPALVDVSGRYAQYAEHVRELLKQYARRSHGKITVEMIAPEPYSTEEDRAAGFGLRSVPFNNEGDQGYFGIAATNTTDQIEAIPFLTPEREAFLEYDLTRLVETLQTVKKPVVGLLDGTGTAGSWASFDQLRQLFTLRTLEANTPVIDRSIAVLVLVHPKDLPPLTLFAIDQFVLAGGHALVFVDPDAESINAPGMPPGDGASDLPELFKSWGISYNPGKVAADWDQAMRIQAVSAGREVVTEFPPYIAVKPPYLNAADPITGDLKVVDLVTSGALEKAAGAQTQFTPLIQTSPHAALVDTPDATAQADPLALLSRYQPGTASLTLAARIEGNLSSAFPNGPTQARTVPSGPYLKTSAKPAEIVVVADADMLSNPSWVEMREVGGQKVAIPFASNGDFLTGAVENLTGTAALSSLRGRGVASRPLVRLEDMERQADAQFRATQEELSRRLEEIQRQLLTLFGATGKPSASAPVLNERQQETMRRFRTEMNETRRKLRDVQHDLNSDIEHLETRIRIVDIGAMPLAVILAAVLFAWHKRRRPA